MFSFNFACVGYGKLQSPQKQWINNHMTFGEAEAPYRLVLLCSSVKKYCTFAQQYCSVNGLMWYLTYTVDEQYRFNK